MRPSESSVTAALAAAQELVRIAATTAVSVVATNLLMLMKSAGTYRERGQLAATQTHILQTEKRFIATLGEGLLARVNTEIGPKGDAQQSRSETDWESVSLVDETKIEERISLERIGQLISHNCDAELRDMAGYMSTLLGHAWADPERNPLRGDVLGSVVHTAIEKTSEDPAIQAVFSREFGKAFALEMPACYREIIADLVNRGIRPVDVSMRPIEALPGRSGYAGSAGAAASAAAAPPLSEEARKAWEASWQGRNPFEAQAPSALRNWENSLLGRFAEAEPTPDNFDPQSSLGLLDRLIRGGMPGAGAGVRPPPESPAGVQADAEILSLLRRINQGAVQRGEFGPSRRDSGPGSLGGNDGFDTAAGALAPRRPVDFYAQPPASGLSDLMAVNLIRAHRDELMQASRGKLDHLVIEVVSSLFDQILSDARVPPAMAHQIARLQLPVLRVALNDPGFFSSRRHPVRRFINRAASLACAFDDLESGPGKKLLGRISELVKEIVDGDFDQLELYDAKLLELERFTAEQAQAEVRDSAVAGTLRTKELEWHVQQRFSWQMHTALGPLTLPPFLREFLSGVWGEVIVLASRREGADAAYPAKVRRTGMELVISIQPQRSLEQRKHFLATLPGLMVELTAGMELVEWPKALRDDFFGQLMKLHAGSLKGVPQSDLDYNMLLRHLEAAFATPVPTAEEARSEPPPTTGPTTLLEQRFSVEEGEAIFLVEEDAVDWASNVAPQAGVDIPLPFDHVDFTLPLDGTLGAFPSLDATVAAAPGAAPMEASPVSPELESGPQLQENLQLGFSYRLNLKDKWEKVRLTYMSPGRSLFLFSHGAKDLETISMTARTMGRLCASGRLRAFENAFLLDRATQRARQQLAALDSGRDRRGR